MFWYFWIVLLLFWNKNFILQYAPNHKSSENNFQISSRYFKLLSFGGKKRLKQWIIFFRIFSNFTETLKGKMLLTILTKFRFISNLYLYKQVILRSFVHKIQQGRRASGWAQGAWLIKPKITALCKSEKKYAKWATFRFFKIIFLFERICTKAHSFTLSWLNTYNMQKKVFWLLLSMYAVKNSISLQECM